MTLSKESQIKKYREAREAWKKVATAELRMHNVKGLTQATDKIREIDKAIDRLQTPAERIDH